MGSRKILELRPKRVQYNLKVSCLDSYRQFEANAENISMEGICIRTPRPCEEGKDISVFLRLPNLPKTLAIPSRVIWTDVIPDGDRPGFRSGLQYLYINNDYKKAFRDFMSVLSD